MTLPIAGWYPDPQDSNRTRWWDGARWGALAPQPAAAVPTPQWEPAPRPPAPSEYRAAVTEQPLRGRKARIAKDRATRAANPFGYAGLVLALLGFIVNVFAIPGVLGIVFGAIGLARAGQLTGQRITGFGVSLAAVILGLAASAAFVVRAAQLLA
ncbi:MULTISPECIES: DUF2510 domain-containing protein [unclassified Curtobacterium]|uniref:DUF2510 domain-containing protein n=1 Tax=unclassified Curtobacterium TaxID=257496 RepID=UPI0021DB4E1F|nr:DUF2510 domain-containing protein [Curtobacterium sp. RIT-PI-V]